MNRLVYETEDNKKGLSQAQQTGIQLVFSGSNLRLSYPVWFNRKLEPWRRTVKFVEHMLQKVHPTVLYLGYKL